MTKNGHSLRLHERTPDEERHIVEFTERKISVHVTPDKILPILWHFSACLPPYFLQPQSEVR